MENQLRTALSILKVHFKNLEKQYPGLLKVLQREVPGLPNLTRMSLRGGAPKKTLSKEKLELLRNKIEDLDDVDFFDHIVDNKPKKAKQFINDNINIERLSEQDIENFVYHEIATVHGESFLKLWLGNMITWFLRGSGSGAGALLITSIPFINDVLQYGLETIGATKESMISSILSTIASLESIEQQLKYELGLQAKPEGFGADIIEIFKSSLFKMDFETSSYEQLTNLAVNFTQWIIYPIVFIILLSGVNAYISYSKKSSGVTIQQIQQQQPRE